MPTTTDTVAAWITLQSFSPAVHAAFREHSIDLYRVPRYTDKPTDAREPLSRMTWPNGLGAPSTPWASPSTPSRTTSRLPGGRR